MRAKRILLAGIVSVLALSVVPSAGAASAMKEGPKGISIGCCHGG